MRSVIIYPSMALKFHKYPCYKSSPVKYLRTSRRIDACNDKVEARVSAGKSESAENPKG
jgi:hypothetical protein